MAKTARIAMTDSALVVVVVVAAAATAATALIRWGEGGAYSLGPTLPWAYFVGATVVGLMLSSPWLLPRGGEGWTTRVFATTYVAIALAGIVNLAFAILLFYADGVQRSLHSMFSTERTLYTLLGVLIYIMPLSLALFTGVLVLSRSVSRSARVALLALFVFTLAQTITEFVAEYVVYHLRG